jgi:hypothetical protein
MGKKLFEKKNGLKISKSDDNYNPQTEAAQWHQAEEIQKTKYVVIILKQPQKERKSYREYEESKLLTRKQLKERYEPRAHCMR